MRQHHTPQGSNNPLEQLKDTLLYDINQVMLYLDRNITNEYLIAKDTKIPLPTIQAVTSSLRASGEIYELAQPITHPSTNNPYYITTNRSLALSYHYNDSEGGING